MLGILTCRFTDFNNASPQMSKAYIRRGRPNLSEVRLSNHGILCTFWMNGKPDSGGCGFGSFGADDRGKFNGLFASGTLLCSRLTASMKRDCHETFVRLSCCMRKPYVLAGASNGNLCDCVD